MDVKIIGTKLYIDGFLYGKNIDKQGKIYWRCRRNYEFGCPARAITSDPLKKEKLQVYKGPNESKHNHEMSPSEVQTVEKMADIVLKRIECRMLTASLSPSDTISDIGADSKSFSKSKENGQTGHKSEWTRSDEVRLARNYSNSVASHKRKVKVEAESVRLIGKRLCIDNFIYTKQENRSELSWVCKRYRKSNCSARAITSNPSRGEMLIVYKGLESSKHNHPASLKEVKEAEIAAKVGRKAGRKPKLKDSGVRAPSETNLQAGKVLQVSELNVLARKTEAIESDRKRPLRVTAGKKEYFFDSEDDLDGLPPRLIGKRLCIDGYIYVSKSYTDDRIHWECRRYRTSTGECQAKAYTTNPLNGGKLIVFKGPQESNHNHPPCPAEVKDSEHLAAFEPKSMRIKSNEALKKSIKIKSETVVPDAVPDADYNYSGSLEKEKKSLITEKFQKARRSGRKILLSDPEVYRRFLLKFSKRPKFSRKYVMRALKSIYKSERSRFTAYINILESQEKVIDDLDALNNNPNVSITALDSNNSFDAQDHQLYNTVNSEESKQGILDGCDIKTEPIPEVLEAQEQHPPLKKYFGDLPQTEPPTPIEEPLPSLSAVDLKQEPIPIDVTDYFIIKQEYEPSGESRVVPV